ncbi:MAG: hypothetical protein KGJ62_00325 [Armatimonadetes bacterium]|nr:hypothetical protein [Armatimonadota bacterium]MDE2206067.1 hypothetical protein [Armatimonadota bacterium]
MAAIAEPDVPSPEIADQQHEIPAPEPTTSPTKAPHAVLPAPAPGETRYNVIGLKRTPGPSGARGPTPGARTPAPAVPGPIPLRRPAPAPRHSAPAAPVQQPSRVQPSGGAAPASNRAALPAALTAAPLLDGTSESAETAVNAAADLNVPPIGTFTPTKSKYYVGHVVDPVSGTVYDADSGRPTDAPPRMPPSAPVVRQGGPMAEPAVEAPAETPYMVAVFRYAVVLLLIVLVAGFLTRTAPTAQMFAITLFGCTFLGGVLLPVMGVGPWQDEDASDWVWLVLLTLVFGPLVSLAAYCVVCMARWDSNPSVFGCFVVALVARIACGIGISAGSTAPAWTWQMMPFVATGGHFSLFSLALNWAGAVALLGWIVANLFHKMDE